MRFFNDCKEHLEKLGLSPCEAPIFEDESTPTEDLLDMAAQLSSDKDILSRDYDLPPDHNLLSQPMGFEDAIEMDLNPNPAIYFQPTNSGSNGVSSSCSSSLGHPFYPHPDQPSNQYTDLLYGEEADMMETTALHIPQTSTVCPSLLMDLSPQTPSSQTFRGRSPTFASIPSSATSSQAANPTTNSSAPRPSQDPLIYTCRKNCGKGFKGISRRSNRTRHENSVHGEENVCKRCGVRLKVGRADYRKSHDRACKGR